MKTASGKPFPASAPSAEVVRLRARLAEAEETLRAIRSGEVDTVLVAGRKGHQVFTLEGAEHAYRELIESMNEGALTLTADKTILYANRCFAHMVGCPLEQVIGSSFRRFISGPERDSLRPLLKRAGRSGAKIQVQLKVSDGSEMAAQISVRPLQSDDFNHATLGMVVTDMTEAKRVEGLLRNLAHRVVQVQEAERAAVALELHDHITQQLCGVLFRCQSLADGLAPRAGPELQEALRLREMLGEVAAAVERISRDLRPGALEHLGLAAVMGAATTEFATRTGLVVKLECAPLAERPPSAVELALYRILQEALKNVESHARARHVTVRLTQPVGFIQLSIEDDGIGFDPEPGPADSHHKSRLGLLSMRERAAYVGGVLTVKTGPRAGTEIAVRVPLPPARPALAPAA